MLCLNLTDVKANIRRLMNSPLRFTGVNEYSRDVSETADSNSIHTPNSPTILRCIRPAHRGSQITDEYRLVHG
jgi:hypothetical protein